MLSGAHKSAALALFEQGDGLAPTTFAEEELQLNILSALTNLTYYEDESNCLLHEQARLQALAVSFLISACL
eukprot:6094701-Pleurochrysis_carterae.AAC.1